MTRRIDARMKDLREKLLSFCSFGSALEESRFSRRRPAIKGENEGVAWAFLDNYLNGVRLLGERRHHHGSQWGYAGMGNKAERAIGMRRARQIVAMGDLGHRSKRQQEQKEDPEEETSRFSRANLRRQPEHDL